MNLSRLIKHICVVMAIFPAISLFHSGVFAQPNAGAAATVAPAPGHEWTLKVQSSPEPGVSITGTKPGVTPYEASVPEGDLIMLTAPEVSGKLHFKQWSDGAGGLLTNSRTLPFSIAGAATPSQLYAGTAKVDVSPENTVEDHGQIFCMLATPPNPPVPPKNIHDPLYARVVVLKNDTASVAIVALDLPQFSSKWVIDQAKSLYKLDHVVMVASHTHSGMWPRAMAVDTSWTNNGKDPGVSLDWPGFSSDPWYAATEKKVLAAIGQANSNLFPARIASGQGPFESRYVTHNRRHVNPDGTVDMWWANPGRLPTSPVDHTLRVIRVEDEKGNPRVLMVHYACHPVIMMNNGMISADFPGETAKYIEGKLGPDCMAMYLQGAEGDIDPYEFQKKGPSGFEYLAKAGADLGQGALDLSAKVPSPKDNGTLLQVKENSATVNYRNGKGTSDACLTTILINSDLAMVSMPAEVFCQHQLNLAAESPIPNTFILGLGYSGKGSPYMLYIPTAQAAKEGGYGAGNTTYVEPDAGEKMVNTALASIRSFKDNTTVVANYADTPQPPSTPPKSVIVPARIQAEEWRARNGFNNIVVTDDTDGVADLYSMQPPVAWSYNITVPAGGNFIFTLRANPKGKTNVSFHVEIDNVNVTGSLTTTGLPDPWTYESLVSKAVPLTAGDHVMKVVCEGTAWPFNVRFNWIEVSGTDQRPSKGAGQ